MECYTERAHAAQTCEHACGYVRTARILIKEITGEEMKQRNAAYVILAAKAVFAERPYTEMKF